MKPLLNPLLTQSQRGYGQPLAMQVRIQIVKNLESLTCLEIKKNKSRAVAYARVSSKRQAEEGVSLDAQVERLLAYAEFRGLDLDPEDIYIDDGISAAIHLWSRPAGRKMRETIYQERVGHVLALKMDRLFRDVQDC